MESMEMQNVHKHKRFYIWSPLGAEEHANSDESKKIKKDKPHFYGFDRQSKQTGADGRSFWEEDAFVEAGKLSNRGHPNSMNSDEEAWTYKHFQCSHKHIHNQKIKK